MDNNIACLKIEKVLWNKFIEQGFLKTASLIQIQKELKSIEPELEAMYKEYWSENDWRDGFDTYGYVCLEDIKDNLKYISDRWSCQFRLKWLLDLINIEITTEFIYEPKSIGLQELAGYTQDGGHIIIRPNSKAKYKITIQEVE